jgi:hypothetical protein
VNWQLLRGIWIGLWLGVLLALPFGLWLAGKQEVQLWVQWIILPLGVFVVAVLPDAVFQIVRGVRRYRLAARPKSAMP